MGLYTETDIYRPARSLALLVVKYLRSIPRDYQRSIGDDARYDAFKIVLLIMRANIARGANKVPHIEQLLEHLEVLKLTLCFADELGVLSHDQHAETMDLSEEIGKQATGWKAWAAGAPAT
jgi:hypothetical protein